MEIYEQETKLYKSLMHPARLAILDLLREGEACVCHMEATFKFRQAYISQQLMVLKEAGLVEVRRDGLNIYYRVIRPEIFGVMDAMRETYGEVDRTEGVARVRSLFHGLRTDWIFDGTPDNRERWHNLKYYTWVEQQGKTVEELEAQRCDEWWEAEQTRVGEIDAKLREYRQSQQS